MPTDTLTAASPKPATIPERSSFEGRTRAAVTTGSFWIVSAVYFAISLVLAARKPLWNDELFTFYIAQRPSMADVWKVLLTGAEQLPPLFYVITRAFTHLFGLNQLALRLPEIIGFWLMGVGLYWFVRRRFSSGYALAAMLFPMLTDAYSYAVEARPYGLVLGFSAIALLFWKEAVDGRDAVWPRIGLALSLAAAVSCHYYAVFVFVPLGLAEGARFLATRKTDLKTWLALAAGGLPLFFYLPLIHAARAYSSTFWAKPSWNKSYTFFEDLLYPAVLVLFVIPLLTAFFSNDRAPSGPRLRELLRSIPAYEALGVLGFLSLPFVGVILAKTVTGAYTSRYVLPAIIGLSVALIYSVAITGRRNARLGWFIAAVMLVLFGLNSAKAYRQFQATAEARTDLYKFLQPYSRDELPIVIAGPHQFFELSHTSARRPDKLHLTFLADTKLAIERTGTDDVELGLLVLRQYAPLDVRDFRKFCAATPAFLLYGETEPFAWIAGDLIREGWTLTVVARHGSHFLYQVSARNRHSA